MLTESDETKVSTPIKVAETTNELVEEGMSYIGANKSLL